MTHLIGGTHLLGFGDFFDVEVGGDYDDWKEVKAAYDAWWKAKYDQENLWAGKPGQEEVDRLLGVYDGLRANYERAYKKAFAVGAGPAKPLPGRGRPGKLKSRGLVGRGRVKKGASPHRVALSSAAIAGDRALKAAKRVAAKAAKYKADVKAKKHGPLVPIAATKVSVGGEFVLGVAPKAKRALSSKQRAAVTEHAKAVGKTAKAARRLGAAAVGAKRAGVEAKKFVEKAVPFIQKKLRVGKGASKPSAGAKVSAKVKPGGTKALAKGAHLLGALVEALDDAELEALSAMDEGEALDIVEMLGQDASPEAPSSAGTDGGADADTRNERGAGGIDQETGQVFAPDGSVIYDPASDPDVLAMPERGQPLTQDEARQTWRARPEDAIPAPFGSGAGGPGWTTGWGSARDVFANIFTGGAYVLTKNIADAAKSGGKMARRDAGADQALGSWSIMYGDGGTAPGFMVVADKKGNTKWMFRWKTGDKWREVNQQERSDLAVMNNRSIQLGWGPLVGNPNNPATAGLQWANDSREWFWQANKAPSYASAEVDAKIAEANEKTIKAKQAEAIAIAAEMAQAEAEAAEERARHDAEIALREEQREETRKDVALKEEQAASERGIQEEAASSAQAAEEAKIEQERARAEIEYQRQAAPVELEIAKQEAALAAEEQHALIDQAQVWNEWAKKNPEAAMAELAADEAAEGGDEYLEEPGAGPSEEGLPDFGSEYQEADPLAEGEPGSVDDAGPADESEETYAEDYEGL